MFSRVRDLRGNYPEWMGGGLIVVGFVLFIAVFLAVFPVLTDPAGTYDDWFPEDEATVAEPVAEEARDTAEPEAGYRFVAEASMVEPAPSEGEGEPTDEGAGEPQEPSFIYEVTLENRSEPGDFEIVAWIWDLGDGTEAEGETVEHTYERPGVYSVILEIEDAGGTTDRVEGDVDVPEDGRAFGRVDASDDIDLSGIESAVEDAVGTLEVSVDDTLDSIGSAVRSAAIIVLFALAAIATTVVAWRLTRGGIMLLQPAQSMRMKVKSADMHVEVGRTPLTDLADAELIETDKVDDQEPELIEV